jgi:hypothetical protein
MTTGFIGLTRQTKCNNNFKVFLTTLYGFYSFTASKTSNASNQTFTSASSFLKSGQESRQALIGFP